MDNLFDSDCIHMYIYMDIKDAKMTMKVGILYSFFSKKIRCSSS